MKGRHKKSTSIYQKCLYYLVLKASSDLSVPFAALNFDRNCKWLELAPVPAFRAGCQGFTGPFPPPFLIRFPVARDKRTVSNVGRFQYPTKYVGYYFLYFPKLKCISVAESDHQHASKACKRSFRISSRSSSPTEILISPGVMFTVIRSASLSFAWVVLAGCDAMLLVSPRLAVRERS